MNGPEHYKEAERLLELVNLGRAGEEVAPYDAADLTVSASNWRRDRIAEAHVHAGLAQTAALLHAGEGTKSAWARVLSGGKP